MHAGFGSFWPKFAAREGLHPDWTRGRPATDYSHLHERSLLQAVFTTPVPNRFDHTELQSPCETSVAQDGFQPAARDRGVRPGGRGPFARDCPPDAGRLPIAPFRAGSGFFPRPAAPVRGRPARPCHQRRCRAPAGGVGAPGHPALRLHRFRNPVQHSGDQEEARLARRKRTRRSRRAVISSSTRSRTNCASTPRSSMRAESEYFLQNIPPMFITVFHKMNRRNGHRRPLRRPAEFSTNHSA